VVSVEGNGVEGAASGPYTDNQAAPLTDVLADTTNPGGEVFTELAAAPADSNFKGVAFPPPPVPEASTWVMMLAGFAGLGFAGRRRFRATIRAAS
jgi:PEP-CTERM motif